VTVATSTVPATLAALTELLVEQDFPTRQPSVTLGLPRQPEREMVIIGNVSGDQQWASIGTQRRDESYTVDLYTVVLWPGYTALEAMQRAWEMFGVVETAIRDNVQVGGTGVLWNEIATPTGDLSVEDEGYAYQVTSALRVRARI
jgi:hypothetical protein